MRVLGWRRQHGAAPEKRTCRGGMRQEEGWQMKGMQCWERFMKTGQIRDYLQYRSANRSETGITGQNGAAADTETAEQTERPDDIGEKSGRA